MVPPKISIALATFNGAKNLRSQLQSIASQTLLPAELVACDDGSTDDTIAILEDFRASAPFPVRMEKNAVNLGITENFLRAGSLCQTKYIAFCDQDDIWLDDKIARCEAAINDCAPDLILHSLSDFWMDGTNEKAAGGHHLPRTGMIDGHKAKSVYSVARHVHGR